MGKKTCVALALATCLLCTSGQAEPAPAAKPSITLGVTTWIPAEAFRNRMAPLLKYLEGELGYPVRLIIVGDMQSYLDAIAANSFDLAYVDGCHASRGRNQDTTRPLVEVEFASPLRSLIIVNAASELDEVSDLVGQPIRVALSTQTMPVRLGLLAIAEKIEKRPDHNFELSVASNNGQVLFDIIEGRAQVGIVRNVALAAMTEPLRSTVRVLATSEPGPNPYLVSRIDIPPRIANQVRDAWLNFEKDPTSAAYFATSPIHRYRKVEEDRFSEVAAFCTRVEKLTTPMLTPPSPPDARETIPSS